MSTPFVRNIDPMPATDLRRLATQFPTRYPYLLTSVDADQCAIDLLLLSSEDQLTLSCNAQEFSLHGIGDAVDFIVDDNDFCSALDRWQRSESIARTQTALPFVGGWFVYLSYELAAQLEPSLTLHTDPTQPVAVASRCRAAVVFSHATGTAQLISEYDGVGLLRQIDADLNATKTRQPMTPSSAAKTNIEATDAAKFQAAVVQAQQAIADGEIYQANLSRQWQMPRSGIDSATLLDALCDANPSPFAAFAALEGLTIISSSPERLVSVKGDVVSTRPIAGTRPRSENAQEDARLVAELLAHPKERAEHVMLIDLERNDLGRICNAGSVYVDEYMVIESYRHVHHIVSNIAGTLIEGTTPGDIIAAVFPGGTITGCPKIRCMQIIADLEQRTRGAYTGSLGYIGRDGQMDLNILIRTLSVTADTITFGAGAGIVADSDPAAELQETTAKAEGLLRALKAVSTCNG